jgi:hypothetical protein
MIRDGNSTKCDVQTGWHLEENLLLLNLYERTENPEYLWTAKCWKTTFDNSRTPSFL